MDRKVNAPPLSSVQQEGPPAAYRCLYQLLGAAVAAETRLFEIEKSNLGHNYERTNTR